MLEMFSTSVYILLDTLGQLYKTICTIYLWSCNTCTQVLFIRSFDFTTTKNIYFYTYTYRNITTEFLDKL